ncbi:MAG: dockerin type I domain-containing protein [Phycisphaerales bacterium]|jgi:hypothetical protein
MGFKRYYSTGVAIFLIAAMVCGDEFQVNTRTSLAQANAAAAAGWGGEFVIVWSSRYSTSGRSNDIVGQCFWADCRPIGEEFLINSERVGNQTVPSVAVDSGGNFVVAWQGPGEDEEDIFARRFDSGGRSLGDEFRVNSNTIDRQLCPDVAMDGDGNFVIVWESMGIIEEGEKAICGQLYDSNGLEIGEEFVVNKESYDCRNPDVAMGSNGDFVVVWLQNRTSKLVMSRLYHCDGAAKTEPFEVSTVKISSLTGPSVAANFEGRFVVSWDGNPNSAGEDDVHVRLYDSDGIALGEQFVVNTTIEGPQQNPRVAMDERGRFVVVWDCEIDPDINELEIFAQRFDSSGGAIGGEFQVNTYMADDQKQPAVAMGNNGEYIVAWQSKGQDGSKWGIFADAGQIVGSADFNGDGLINFIDYCILAEEWLRSEDPLITDLTEDGKVNERDLVEFYYQWLVFQ